MVWQEESRGDIAVEVMVDRSDTEAEVGSSSPVLIFYFDFKALKNNKVLKVISILMEVKNRNTRFLIRTKVGARNPI